MWRLRQGEFFFKDGDRAVVMGDSITEQHLYSNYLEAWTWLPIFPERKITFYNVGIGGDRSPSGSGRFVRDVAEYKPTVLTVEFGMNDAGYKAFQKPLFDNYMAGLAGIAKQAKESKLRVAWITPSPVERKENGPAIVGYNLTLEKFSEGVKKVAAENGGLFVDQFHPCVAVENKARAVKPSNRITGGDMVHFGPPGHALMASAILKGMSSRSSWRPSKSTPPARSQERQLQSHRGDRHHGRRQVHAARPGGAVLPGRGCFDPRLVADPGGNEPVHAEGRRAARGQV